jgi:hypothetical protein
VALLNDVGLAHSFSGKAYFIVKETLAQSFTLLCPRKKNIPGYSIYLTLKKKNTNTFQPGLRNGYF